MKGIVYHLTENALLLDFDFDHLKQPTPERIGSFLLGHSHALAPLPE